ncbi:Sarcosine/dimethylglycine N-methyltransferase [compost metagenome]|uniref:Class I SAM-dependent methyltransferase n=1 Tax=Silvania hatchlandensis TaxID=2926469 RepID=A0A9J6Q7E1_9ENTR|nr:class I SAM-dependent methyltransferase [Silvania hatchlandensis]MCU6664269.1 class I SAM-dependent methyltransferase [Silvania hatchlandensis]
MSASDKAGHTFLASLGKTRLRPGGVDATEWLFRQSELTPDSVVLEVACNMGTTSIELAQRFGCTIYAIDMDKNALEQARQNVAAAGLQNKIHVLEANATRLPFADDHFDVVINEAMLTMYVDKAKTRLIDEYYRVLKPGGRLLTHDIMFTSERLASGRQTQLEEIVRSNVSPMSQDAWKALFIASHFQSVDTHNGSMSLMSPAGLIRDEGLPRAAKILFNGLRTRENRTRFLGMFRFFRRNRHQLNYIACCSRK